MWSIFSGTIVNVVTVAVGSLLGLSISGSLPERYRSIVLQALGLVTVTLRRFSTAARPTAHAWRLW